MNYHQKKESLNGKKVEIHQMTLRILTIKKQNIIIKINQTSYV